MSGVSAEAQGLLALAEEAAHAAGARLVESFRSAGRHRVHAKSTPTDLVSEADVEAERLIREVIGAARPDDAILGEEGGDSAGSSGVRWFVDPLDGTVNFLFGIPQWCVSVAADDGSGTVVGVVHDPLHGETFSVARGGTPTLNGEPIRPSDKDELALAMCATGFAYDARVRARQAEIASRVLPRVRDIRRAGAAALDLAWLACGRFDVYYERGVNKWDVAAGALLCEAGGLVIEDLAAADDLPPGLLVAPAGLVEPLRALVA